MNEPVGLRARVPCAGFDARTAVKDGLSGSVSFASTPLAAFTNRAVPLCVLYESLAATGGSLTAATAIETVAVLLVREPSLAR